MDAKRKDGIKEIKKKLALILDNDSIALSEKLSRLQDTEYIRAFMLAYFAEPSQEAEESGDEEVKEGDI